PGFAGHAARAIVIPLMLRRRPKARTRVFNALWPPSRSMRAPSSSFETRARLFLFCGISSGRALLRMRTAELAARCRTVFGNFHLTMSNSPSRSRGALLRPGFASLLRQPESRGGRSAERRSGAAAPVRRAHDAARQALARRLASHDAAIYGPK